MAIQQFPVVNGAEINFVPTQARLAEVGRIRFGVYNAEDRRPEKIENLRFTSEHPELIEQIAKEYGGTPEPFAPQGSRGPAKEWQVLTGVSAVPVWVPQQVVEPWLEAWRPGTCIRRCDGVTESRQTPKPCPCAAGEIPVKDVCKPIMRVAVMLDEIRGTGTWRFESHGRHAVQEMLPLIPYIAALPGQAFAILRLRKEERRPWVEAKGKHMSTVFYVPYLYFSDASSRQLTGAEAVAIEPAGARPALTAGPVDQDAPGNRESGTAAQAAETGAVAGVTLSDTDRHQILVAIEGAQTVERLMEIYGKLKARGVKDEAVKGALGSKQAALDAAAEIEARKAAHQSSLRAVQRDAPPPEADMPPEYAVGDTVEVAGIEFTKHSDDPFGPGSASDLINAVRQADAGIVDAVLVEPADDGRYDEGVEFAAVFAEAGPLGWTTADVHDKIKLFCKVARSVEATGGQLHAMRAAMRDGTLR
jgi:hypothetical protein